MTRLIKVRNVNEALGEGFQWLKVAGIDEPSRNGPVRVAPDPVVTEYTHPTERVLFNIDRDANPVFHLLESIWMLAGRDDVGFLLPYNARMALYAEPNGAVHGAYGYRWRKMFGVDQLLEIANELRRNPSSRQCVLQMWSAQADLGAVVKDRPCNTHVYFDCRGGALNMTVCCRSNDILWGAYGANAVHFSMMQELVAWGAEVPVGVYRQMSNNFHAYTDVPMAARFLVAPPFYEAAYPAVVYPMLAKGETVGDFLIDCHMLCKGAAGYVYATQFFTNVVAPLKRAYDSRKAGSRTWRLMLDDVANCDWKLGFIEWTERRPHGGE